MFLILVFGLGVFRFLGFISFLGGFALGVFLIFLILVWFLFLFFVFV